METQAVRRVTITEQDARRYRELFAQFQDSIGQYCDQHGIPLVQISGEMTEAEILRTVTLGRKNFNNAMFP